MSRPTSLILTAFTVVVMLFSAKQTSAQSLSVSTTLSNYNCYSVSCYASEDGSINLTVSGGTVPYTYLWNTVDGSVTADGAITEDLSSLKAGTYTVIVNDSVGAADTLDIVLSQPSSLSASLFSPSFNGFNIHCEGGSDGQITTTVNGGVAPFQYLWSTGDTLPNIGGLAAGNYQLVVTGANGCKDTSNITLTEPPLLNLQVVSPELTAAGHNLDCAGGSSGSIDLTVTGGAGLFIYNWSNGAITEDLLSVELEFALPEWVRSVPGWFGRREPESLGFGIELGFVSYDNGGAFFVGPKTSPNGGVALGIDLGFFIVHPNKYLRNDLDGYNLRGEGVEYGIDVGMGGYSMEMPVTKNGSPPTYFKHRFSVGVGLDLHITSPWKTNTSFPIRDNPYPPFVRRPYE